jgi:hypothetical protein
MTEAEKVYSICLSKLDENPAGLKFTELCQYAQAEDNSLRHGTIAGALTTLCQARADKVFKPERGLYQLLKYKNTTIFAQVSSKKKIKEEDFYEGFAGWITSEIEDCTIAKPLGGNYFGPKWGTPDVMGVLKQDSIDPYKTGIEIVSVEIKISADQLVTAFGQACSYKLFSHKVYLVIPADPNRKEEIARIDSLCYLFGIGLVLFNPDSVDNPKWELKHRAQKHTPDPYYVNQNIKKYPGFWKGLL